MLYNFYRRRLQQELGLRLDRAGDASRIDRKANTLVFYIEHELARTQIYPLLHWRGELRRRHGQRLQYLPTDQILTPAFAQSAPNRAVERIFVQTPLNADADTTRTMLTRLTDRFPAARICYMDWMAPIDTRHAELVDPYIDSYLTKQHFRELAQSTGPFVGDTNLSDYYYRRMGVDPGSATYTLPAGFERKLLLGSNFGFSPQMLDMFLGPAPGIEGRDIDFHARIAVNGVDWYARMRQEAQTAAQSLTGITSVMKGRVRRPEFFAEMRRSKLCFSPFGYGEVCWRDFEAWATGAVLIKPDVGHLKTFPDIFIPDETYVSVDWSLEDLEDKVRAVLAQPERRAEMVARSHQRMREHIVNAEPLQPFLAVMARH